VPYTGATQPGRAGQGVPEGPREGRPYHTRTIYVWYGKDDPRGRPEAEAGTLRTRPSIEYTRPYLANGNLPPGEEFRDGEGIAIFQSDDQRHRLATFCILAKTVN
jgi:hypothetical protein